MPKITDTLRIEIEESSNEPGYMYNIFNTMDIEDAEPLDGGICTGSMQTALESAVDMAQDLMKGDK